MKVLYLYLGMGAAGDMLTAALLELCPDKDKVLGKLNSLNIPGVHFERELMKKSGICGTHMHVLVNGVEEECGCGHGTHDHGHIHEAQHDEHHIHNGNTDVVSDSEPDKHSHHTDDDGAHHTHTHHHTSMSDIRDIVSALNTSDKIKKQILDVYDIIADAESKVHGENVSQIHFHEVGNMDAVADVAAVCTLIDEIGAERIVASAVHTGSGYVMCAHGKLPVPAPATALILRGIPSYSDGIKGELCTPTGAALIKYFADSFSDMPTMSVSEIGYGFGKKEFERLNCVRSFLGEVYEKSNNRFFCGDKKENDTNGCYHAGGSSEKHVKNGIEGEAKDKIVELACNIDDMTAEEIGFAMEKILQAGALDVYTISAYMKKNRPGTIICCICHEEEKDRFVKLIFKYTTTIGVRQYECDRYILSRKTENIKTVYGDVRVKKSSGYGVQREKMEYDDLADIADRTEGADSSRKSLLEIKNEINH